MKKKIFSKLLMGAVLVASISSFVSCKDYDDDISNLQSQIDKAALKADVTALDQKLTAAAAAAKEAADKAEADAQKAQSTADNAATKAALEQAIKDINAAAEAAGKQVAADIKKVADARASIRLFTEALLNEKVRSTSIIPMGNMRVQLWQVLLLELQ